MRGTIRKMVMGNSTEGDLFKQYWENYGFSGRNSEGTKVTAPVQSILHNGNQDKLKENKGMVRKALSKQVSPETKAMDSGEVSGSTPLIFDPEILSLLKQNAPVLDVIAMEGQQGFKAVFNRIDSRDAPIGFDSEANVLDLSSTAGNDISLTKEEVDMEIYVDLAEISDFTQAAAEHYINVADTTLGERVALHAQRKAQQIFYGDPSQATGTGYIGDAEGYEGLSKIFTDASSNVSKTAVTSNFVKDIKSEIHSLIQDENVMPSNLVIMTSWEFFDVLENEADFDNIRTDADTSTVNVGLNSLRIAGVPVIPTHNIDAFSDGAYNAGDPGDVFIFSTRAVRFRALVPFSTIPLAKLGLSETTALFEFGALIDKSGGNFGRYLSGYDF